MRCSWCESWLGEYVDGALAPRRANAVAEHLRGCAACGALAERLRVVDGLLATTRMPELAPEFTGQLMARVRAMPPAPAPRGALPAALFYAVGAWVAGFAALAAVWAAFPQAGHFGLLALGSALQAVTGGAHALWPLAPVAAPAVASLLWIDVLLLAATLLFYRAVRPQLAAYLSAGRARR